MKEATGELNMTVITVVAVAAIGGIFYLFLWPTVQVAIKNATCKAYGNGTNAYQECMNQSIKNYNE